MEILSLCIGSGGLLGILFVIFRTGKIVQQVETISKDTDSLKNGSSEIKTEIASIGSRLSRIEGYLMGLKSLGSKNDLRS